MEIWEAVRNPMNCVRKRKSCKKARTMGKASANGKLSAEQKKILDLRLSIVKLCFLFQGLSPKMSLIFVIVIYIKHCTVRHLKTISSPLDDVSAPVDLEETRSLSSTGSGKKEKFWLLDVGYYLKRCWLFICDVSVGGCGSGKQNKWDCTNLTSIRSDSSRLKKKSKLTSFIKTTLLCTIISQYVKHLIIKLWWWSFAKFGNQF